MKLTALKGIGTVMSEKLKAAGINSAEELTRLGSKAAFARRTHTIKEMATIKEGLPPDRLTRVVKSVRYMLYWEFENPEKYGLAQKRLYETHWKAIDKCLVMPHDKYLGESPF